MISKGYKQRNREGILTTSEIMLIILLFSQLGFRCFKWFYVNCVMDGELSSYFKAVPSYNRFIELMPRTLFILYRLLTYLMYQARKRGVGIEYIDSTKIAVCDNKRISSNKVFDGVAAIGRASSGWFNGFKLHITCDISGNLTGLAFTRANVDDRAPVIKLVKQFYVKLFGDKGYVSAKLSEQLQNLGITLITTPKKNMKAKSIPANVIDIILHKKRVIIESVFNILKNKFQLCHTRHRSIANFIVHIISILLGYQHSDNKPKISLNFFALS